MTPQSGKAGRLRDACRELTEQLAEEQRKLESHDEWLREQVNTAFERLDSGDAVFVSYQDAKVKWPNEKKRTEAEIP